MLSLKLAGEDDAAGIASFFRELFDNSVYRGICEYHADDVEDLVRQLSASPDKGVTIMLLENDRLVGAMICSSMQQIFNRREKTAVEIGFWIKPGARTLAAMKKILGAYRYWARQTGCTSILYGKLKNDDSVESYSLRKLK